MKRIMIPFPSHLARVGGVTSFLVIYCKYMDRDRYELVDIRNSNIDRIKIKKDSLSLRIRRKWNYLLYKKNISDTDAILFFNPSLGNNPVKRFLYLHMNADINTEVTFVHGWNKDYEKKLQNDFRLREQFIEYLKKSCIIFVLATEFKDKLVEWGISESKLCVENTMVDDELLQGFSKDDIQIRFEKENINLLFLSRIIREKGIHELLDAYKILRDKFGNVTLNVAGRGPELQSLMKKAKSEQLDVKFLGFVDGRDKIDLYRRSDIYVLPSETEGCPISLLEALSFGLPAVVTSVGGIPDFFEDERMGFLVEDTSPGNLAALLEKLINDRETRLSMGIYNFEYAKDHFLASKVVKRIESRITAAL